MIFAQRTMLWAFLIVLGASLVYKIHLLPLRDYRETRFAEIGREMLVFDGWILPHLNGTPYLNKPPMVPWLVALSFSVFGVGEGPARLPSVLATFATALTVGLVTHRIFGRKIGALGAALYLGMPGVHYYGRMLMTDTVAAAWIFAATAAFLEGYLQGRARWFRLGFIACGFGVLSRGIVGVFYPLGALMTFLLVSDRKAWRRVPWLTGFLLLLLIIVPWFALVEIKNPGFLYHQFIQQQVERVLLKEAHHFVALPAWQILLSLMGFVGPCCLLLPWTIVKVRGEKGAHLMLWILVCLVVGSVLLSAGRNHPYTIPALPALAALLAGWLGTYLVEDAPALTRRIAGFLIFVFGMTVVGALPWISGILAGLSPLLEGPATAALVRALLTMVGLLSLLSGFFVWRGKGVMACVMVAALMIPGTFMMTHVQGRLGPRESRALLSKYVVQEVPCAWPIVLADPKDHQFEGTGGWCFYTRRQVLMVDFGNTEGVSLQGLSRPDWLLDMQAFQDLLMSGRPFVFAATSEALSRLSTYGLPPYRVRDEKFFLWILNERPVGAAEDSAHRSHTGRISSSRTRFHERA